MLDVSTAGENSPEQLAQLARGKLKNKIPQLALALEGRVRPHRSRLTSQACGGCLSSMSIPPQKTRYPACASTLDGHGVVAGRR